MSFLTCQQCQHLSVTGHCVALDRVRPMVNALRHCEAFSLFVGSRDQVAETPLNDAELNDAYSRVAKPFFEHLKGCKQCDLEKNLFCDEGKELSLDRDAVLMCFEDAESKNNAFISYLKKVLKK